ncbi:hypothetical protein AKJ63_00700, partial [candidate division MSBL1 archaeon SCGC-AAA259D18]
KTRQNISNPNLPTLLIDLKSHRDAKLQKSEVTRFKENFFDLQFSKISAGRPSFLGTLGNN